jgi:membrane fusion protein, multidrug efflux system
LIMMSKNRKVGFYWIGAVTIILTLSLLAGCGKQKEDAGPPMGAVPEVVVAVMREEPVTLFTELPGRTSPFLIAEVRPQVSGIIQKRLFTEGDDVKSGDLLYQIDPAPYQASYDNARAALSRAEANLPAIRSRVERYKELVAIKAVSKQDYDDASAALRQAEADGEVYRAAVETARINLGYTQIKAPIPGRIGKSIVTVGALATAYQGPAMATIQQLDPIYVDATQSSVSLLQLKRNMASGRIKGAGAEQTQVKLFLEDGTAYPLEGILKFSDVTVEPSTGSFILRMVFPNQKHTLLPGMYVRALVREGVVDRGMLVPQQGVSRDPKGNPLALIVDKDDKVQVRTITVERAIGDKWLVTSGLKPGDRVIVEGSQKARPGAPAKVVSPEADSKEKAQPDKPAQPPGNKR